MNTLAQTFGDFNAPNENEVLTVGAYTLKSTTNPVGVRYQSIQTRDKALAQRLMDEAFGLDDKPNFAAAGGVFYIEFAASDFEADKAIEMACGQGVYRA